DCSYTWGGSTATVTVTTVKLVARVLNVNAFTSVRPPLASEYADNKDFKKAKKDFAVSLGKQHRVGLLDPEDPDCGHCPIELTRLPFPEELGRSPASLHEGPDGSGPGSGGGDFGGDGANGGGDGADPGADIWAKMPQKLMKATAKHLLG
ncbi:unnamed protein product, partial [Prorocentrum cordatum]